MHNVDLKRLMILCYCELNIYFIVLWNIHKTYTHRRTYIHIYVCVRVWYMHTIYACLSAYTHICEYLYLYKYIDMSGLILRLCPANEKRRYIVVTPSLFATFSAMSINTQDPHPHPHPHIFLSILHCSLCHYFMYCDVVHLWHVNS